MDWALGALETARLSGSENILDVGCGDGKITAGIARTTSGAVLGIGRSKEMIEFARSRHRGFKLRFEVGEAESFDPAESRDVIASFTALHWVSDHASLLAHFNAVLAAGRRLVLQFPGKGNAAELTEVVRRVVQTERWWGYFRQFRFPWRLFSVELYTQILEDNGFVHLDVAMVPKLMHHEGRAGLAEWIAATWLPFTAALLPERREEFFNEITDRYVDRSPVDQRGSVVTGMHRRS